MSPSQADDLGEELFKKLDSFNASDEDVINWLVSILCMVLTLGSEHQYDANLVPKIAEALDHAYKCNCGVEYAATIN